MSILMDGINNAQSYTAQINSLQSLNQTTIDDPKVFQYALEQNFNRMLEDLISSTNDDDDDDNESDPFAYFTSSSQASLQSLQMQGVLEDVDAQALAENPLLINSLPDTSSLDYLNSLYDLGQLM